MVWILLTPLLSRWPDTGLSLFVLTPVLSRLLALVLAFDFAGGRHGEHFGGLTLAVWDMIGVPGWFSSLTPWVLSCASF